MKIHLNNIIRDPHDDSQVFASRVFVINGLVFERTRVGGYCRGQDRRSNQSCCC